MPIGIQVIKSGRQMVEPTVGSGKMMQAYVTGMEVNLNSLMVQQWYGVKKVRSRNYLNILTTYFTFFHLPEMSKKIIPQS